MVRHPPRRACRADLSAAVDTHQHIMSPAIATHQPETPPPAITLPGELPFLKARIAASRDRANFGDLYVDQEWLLGIVQSGTPDPEHLTPGEGWAAFRDTLRLPDEELKTIAQNLPPYALTIPRRVT